MTKKSVTVIMPCYNDEEYVAEAIESVLNQTYQDFDFIVIDNGSTDHSYDVIKRYEDRITKIKRLKENDVKRVWDAALEAATEYIAIMTSDDLWMPDKLEKQMKVLKENAEYGACFSWAKIFNDVAGTEDGGNNIFHQENRSRYEWLHRFVLGGNCLNFPSAVLKRKLWEVIHDNNEPYWQLGDFIVWIKLVMRCEIYVYPEELVKFRQNGTGMSSRSEAKYIRSLNEQIDITYMVFEKMSNADFVKAFYEELTDQNIDEQNNLEIICEKILVLFKIADKDPIISIAAMQFFYRNFGKPGIERIMETKYKLSFAKIQEYCKLYGGGKIIHENFRVLLQMKRMVADILKDSAYAKIAPEMYQAMGSLISVIQNTGYLVKTKNEQEVENFIEILREVDDMLREAGLTLNIRWDALQPQVRRCRPDDFKSEMIGICNRMNEIRHIEQFIADC